MPWLIANPPGVCGRESEKQAQGNPETAVVEQKIPAVEDSITASFARHDDLTPAMPNLERLFTRGS
jgi:hypothetical protein